MKASIIAVSAALVATVFAAPAGDHVRRNFHERGHNVDVQSWTSTAYGNPSPTGVSPSGVLPPSQPQPTGALPPWQPQPTGSLPPSQPYPSGVLPPPGAVPTGTSDLPSCPVDGVVVCNGPSQFGLCNWGHVFFMDVADGTACIDGNIVGTGIFAAPTPTPTA